MLKFILKQDPNKHIAEVSISTVISNQDVDTTLTQSVLSFICVIVYLMPHVQQLDANRVEAGGCGERNGRGTQKLHVSLYKKFHYQFLY